MKTRHSALLLAATLLAAPTLVSAAYNDDEAPGPMKEECAWEHKGGHHEREHHDKRHHDKRHHDKRHHGGKEMDPARYEQHLTSRMEKLETPELKAQFIATQQARLDMMEHNMTLHRLMAEHKAAGMDNAELKEATLKKIAADHQLKQQQLKQMRGVLSKLNN